MLDFKDAVFIYEPDSVPEELKVLEGVAKLLRSIPGTTTYVQFASTLESAAVQIDDFKSKTCGSPYTLSIINLNMMNDVREINFLLQPNVLGDPRTIFCASLKYMVGEAYAIAREKVLRESLESGRSSSCLDCYAASNRDEVYSRLSTLAIAYLREAEEYEKAKREGRLGPATNRAAELLKKSNTTFFGGSMRSGLYKAVSGASGRFPRATPDSSSRPA
ncbi:MAG TPA: hypothetical protein VEK08_16735 [Planctomycetota bacterium]|nr:hypothetical protein [Planctomycetota bacterium]